MNAEYIIYIVSCIFLEFKGNFEVISSTPSIKKWVLDVMNCPGPHNSFGYKGASFISLIMKCWEESEPGLFRCLPGGKQMNKSTLTLIFLSLAWVG